MKNLAKCFALVFVSLICLQVSAQSSFRIQAGINLANVLEKDDDGTYSDEYKMNLGFHAGFGVDISLSDIISLEPGLLLETKGFKIKDSYAGIDYVAKLNLFYLDVPIMLKGAYDFGNGFKIYGAAGPYIGVGLFGNMVAKVDDDKETETVEWGSDWEDGDMLKRLDYGLGFGAGVEINKLLLGISYDLGLANVSAYTENGTKGKHRVLKFTVGIAF